MSARTPMKGKKKILLACGAGAAVIAVSLASAAGLGGLFVDKIGAESGIVADPFSDGVEVSWGEPEYVDGEYVVSTVTVARSGISDDNIVEGSFSTLRDSDQTNTWFKTNGFHTGTGSTAVSDAGIRFDAPVGSKAGVLYYSGVKNLADVEIGNAGITYYGDAGDQLIKNMMLAQIPVYIGTNPEDLDVVAADNVSGSPIFSTNSQLGMGFVLHPVGNMTQTETNISFSESTEFRLMPSFPAMLAAVDFNVATPNGASGEGAATWGYFAHATERTADRWRGTVEQFVNHFPNAVTPGMWLSLSTNTSTDDDYAIVTDATFGGSTWSFEGAPLLPAGELKITVANEDGTVAQEATASSDGSSNAQVFTLTAPIKVTDIKRVSVVMYGVN